MKKINMILLIVALFLLLPLAVNARQGRISFLLEGGKAWGASLDGPFASAKIFFPLTGRVSLQAGYIHYFNPTEYEYTPNKRSGFTFGLQFKTRKGISIAAFAQAVSGQKVIYNDNTLYNTHLRVREQSAYLRLDLESRVPVSGHFEAVLFIRNLLGETYQERYGFPAAGRTAGLSLKTGF